MKLIYLTSQRFPASSGLHVYVRELSKRFTKILGENFLLVIGNNSSSELEGIPYLNLKLPLRFRTLFYFLWLPFFLLKRGLNNKETVFFTPDSNLLVLLIIWRIFFKYRIVSDWHHLFGNWRDSFISKRSDYLITTSDKLKKALVDGFNIDESKVLRIHGGVSLSKKTLDKDEARKKFNLPLDRKIVGYMGFFRAIGMEKGLKTMILSLPYLNKDINMLLVGGKDEEIKEYQDLAKSMGVLDRCIFSGKKTQEELAMYEVACDALAIPYPDQPHFRDYGFPMKVYEYMASGRPIIYSKLELVEEVIGDCAISFIPDSAEDFARAVKEILSNDKKREELSARALRKLDMYTWEKKAEKILEFINK